MALVQIHGHEFRGLIDGGSSRNFISLSCVTQSGLKSENRDTFLDLGNGTKVLSRGHVLNIPVVTAGFTNKLDLTVTSLLHEVDPVLGMTWLQEVGPLIHWSSWIVYILDSERVTRMKGKWL